MNSVLQLGKFLYALPMAIFGIMHFMSAEDMAGMAPGGKIMVYITGVALILAAISIIIGKMDKLASFLLGIMLLLFIIPHAQNLAENSMEMINILKNVALAGGAFMYAQMAKDNAYIK